MNKPIGKIIMSIDTSKSFDYYELLRSIVRKREDIMKNGQKASRLSRGEFIMQ